MKRRNMNIGYLMGKPQPKQLSSREMRRALEREMKKAAKEAAKKQQRYEEKQKQKKLTNKLTGSQVYQRLKRSGVDVDNDDRYTYYDMFELYVDNSFYDGAHTIDEYLNNMRKSPRGWSEAEIDKIRIELMKIF